MLRRFVLVSVVLASFGCLLATAGLAVAAEDRSTPRSSPSDAGASLAPSPEPSPRPSLAPSPEPQVVLSGKVEVPKNTTSGEVVVFHGPASIDGMVEGDVVVLDGPVTVSGLVTGDVVGLNGPVVVTRDAHVVGDVMSRRAAVVEGGARVDGQVRQISGTLTISLRLLGFVLWWIPVTFSTLVLGLVLLWWFPRATDAIAAAAATNPGASIGWGFFVSIGLPVLAVIAIVTLIGIPFGVGLMFAFGVLYSSGYIWGAWALGRFVVKPPGGRFAAFLVGWAILRAVALVPWLGGLSTCAAMVFGFGAVAVAAYRARALPAPPPQPAAVPQT